jgi:hypothetical protein
MMVTTDKRSLYEDWLVRRERLAHDTEGIEQYRRIQLQLLDYLIERYRDAPEVRRPARFPLAIEVYVNERAMLVHNHLWRGQTSGTKSRFEVKNRVAAIVERMKTGSRETAEAAGSFSDVAVDDSAPALPSFASLAEPPDEPAAERPSVAAIEESGCGTGQARLLARVAWAINWLRWQIYLTAWSFANGLFGPGSTSRQIALAKVCHLLKKFAKPSFRDEWLLIRLQDCDHPHARRAAFQAWLDRIRAGCNDEIGRRLQRSFGALDEGQLDSIRALLAHASADVRTVAMEMLATHGTLDDVSLLCDLLNLPRQADEHPRERATLGLAAERIAQRYAKD